VIAETAAYHAVQQFFAEGGAFMYPIAAVLVLGAVVAVERLVYLSVSSARSQHLWRQLVPLLQAGQLREAALLCQRSTSSMGVALNYALARIACARRRDDVEQAMEESLMDVRPRLERGMHYLATLANIATLLGLLGTIMGLINAFTAVAHASAAEKADLLSGSISVAMNTTAFGLLVAIPLLIVHALIRMKTTMLVDSLRVAVIKFISTVVERRAAA
jgi:biopolymer transport protein ExbB